MTGKTPHKAPPTPNAGLKMSPEGRASMRATEKAVYRYYNDMGKNKGNCTWGVGILAHRGVCSEDELKLKVSVAMVDQEFEKRVAEAERAVRRNTRVALNQAQFDALVSLIYNAGATGTANTLKFINKGDFAGAANNISRMTQVTILKDGKKQFVSAPGLVKRRKEESEPFRIHQANLTENK